jgi:hypothetical protein
MQNIDQPLPEEAVESLPTLAWLFMGIAFVPHVLALVGQDVLALIASSICFPVSMGPFALAHATILVSRLGFTSHMAWISALIFSLTWFVLVYWFWKKSRAITVAVGAFSIVISAGWSPLLLLPQA